MIYTFRNLRRLHTDFTGLADRAVASPSASLLFPLALKIFVWRQVFPSSFFI
jgi:hypothetical protein